MNTPDDMEFFVTREDIVAEIYSRLNGVLALGNSVSPLRTVARETPAVAGDLQVNFQILNRDAQGIAKQLLDTEAAAANLYNLFASSQNNLRQMIRERLFQPSQKLYSEEFINSQRLDSQTTASIDYNAGLATAPLLKEIVVAPDQAKVGVSSDGSSTTDPGLLLDGLAETAFVWDGSQVELVFSFNTPQVLNRFRVNLPAHQGLAVVEFTSSPDGVLKENLLVELPTANLSIDGSAGKYSGDWIADFDPRYVKQIRIVLADFIGGAIITVRDVICSQRRYGNSALAQSLRIDAPQGTVAFRAEQHVAAALTSISHQISTDGVHYTGVVPGQQLAVGNKGFWYRMRMERMDSNFDQASAPLDLPGQDPDIATGITVSSIATVDLGNGVLERTINLAAVLGTVSLNDVPLAGVQPRGLATPVCLRGYTRSIRIRCVFFRPSLSKAGKTRAPFEEASGSRLDLPGQGPRSRIKLHHLYPYAAPERGMPCSVLCPPRDFSQRLMLHAHAASVSHFGYGLKKLREIPDRTGDLRKRRPGKRKGGADYACKNDACSLARGTKLADPAGSSSTWRKDGLAL